MHVPPAPSDPPQATPAQLGEVHTPWVLTNPEVQATARQVPRPLQRADDAFEAVHAVVLDALVGAEQTPVDDAHVPWMWHASVEGQVTMGPAMHVPLWQVSGVVHALLSALHIVPLARFA